MPRSKPAWDYANSSGYWVGTPSKALRAAVASACEDLSPDIVERLTERGQVLGGVLRVYEDEQLGVRRIMTKVLRPQLEGVIPPGRDRVDFTS
mgnify:CR=1 FL=1